MRTATLHNLCQMAHISHMALTYVAADFKCRVNEQEGQVHAVADLDNTSLQ